MLLYAIVIIHLRLLFVILMNDELIIQQLKDKEAHLLNEPNKVRMALKPLLIIW
jgi:hypothetical protein